MVALADQLVSRLLAGAGRLGMKLAPRDVAAYARKPDPASAGCLIFGDDAMRVALRRQELLKSLLGNGAEEEMRLTRLAAADLRGDPAGLLDAVKAVGFFPGPRAAFVDGATDGLAPTLATALDEWRPGDAQIIVTAGKLTAASALRKLFEGHKTARAAAIYDEPPGRAEIEALLAEAGLRDIPRDAMGDLEALSRALPPGDFRQTVEKLGLYKRGDATPLSPADIAAVAPLTLEAALDDALNATAEGGRGANRADLVAPLGAGRHAGIPCASRPPPFPRAARRRLPPQRPGGGPSGPAPAGLRPAPRPDAETGAGLGPRQAGIRAQPVGRDRPDLALGAKRATDGADGTHVDPARHDA